jgi:hypothetical protein
MLGLVITRKQLSVSKTSLRKRKQVALVYDELALEKFMRYYGFEKREELLKFLKTQCVQD